MQSISSFLLVNIAASASSYVKQKENERKLKRVVVGRAANESEGIQYENWEHRSIEAKSKTLR